MGAPLPQAGIVKCCVRLSFPKVRRLSPPIATCIPARGQRIIGWNGGGSAGERQP